jgi:hypothetical protein
VKSLPFSKLGWRRGVLHPLVAKSMRMRRTESGVNASRQKGQTGERREDVFSTMFVQQLAHRTCPGGDVKKKRGKGRKYCIPHGTEWGMHWGPYSSAQTSQAEPGLRVSMVPAGEKHLKGGTGVDEAGRRGKL